MVHMQEDRAVKNVIELQDALDKSRGKFGDSQLALAFQLLPPNKRL